MTRVVVLGGGFGDVEVIRRLERKRGGRVDAEVLLISDLRFFPRDSAIMRQPPRCAVCAPPHARSSWERDVA